jgi:hypothetical protein
MPAVLQTSAVALSETPPKHNENRECRAFVSRFFMRAWYFLAVTVLYLIVSVAVVFAAVILLTEGWLLEWEDVRWRNWRRKE